MSDTEFWESSPAKIFALLDYHVKVENPDKAKNDVKNMPKMTPDLFPNMDMPIVVVMTPTVGSTPEKVEVKVTKPLEQALATLDKINVVSSVSNGNYSLIMLEFNNDVNR